MDKKLLIIIPVYNERSDVLYAILDELEAAGFNFLIVDDGSGITYCIDKYSFGSYIRHDKNMGQGKALRTGMEYALKHGYDYCVHMDGDGQHDITAVDTLYRTLINKGVDVVFGSRFLNISDSNVGSLREFVLKSGILLNYLFCGLLLTDSNNGLRAMNRRAMENMKLRSTGMAHASEIIWITNWKRLSYKEVAVNIKYTDYSLSKGQSLWNAFSIGLNLFTLRLSYFFKK